MSELPKYEYTFELLNAFEERLSEHVKREVEVGVEERFNERLADAGEWVKNYLHQVTEFSLVGSLRKEPLSVSVYDMDNFVPLYTESLESLVIAEFEELEVSDEPDEARDWLILKLKKLVEKLELLHHKR